MLRLSSFISQYESYRHNYFDNFENQWCWWHLIALALNDIVDRIVDRTIAQSHLNAVTFRQIFPKTAERNYSIPLIIPATHHRIVDLRQTQITFI